MKQLNPKIWGPHYWFVLFTIAMTYPIHPNDVIKKKYYEFFHNLPIFLPDTKISNDFSKMLDIYPISSYLDNRDSLIRWVHFIHNQINKKLDKPEITLHEALKLYYLNYEHKDIEKTKLKKWKKKYLHIIFVVFIFIIILTTYNI
tara:strand:+ start:2663 stop:3097 length:435 start_codon:yes stop_codon:yes gene_type:complete